MSTESSQEKLTELSLLRDVVQRFGTKQALATELGVSRQAITNMDMDAPLSRLYYLELFHEKRPDLYLAEERVA
jgi:DNA-binding XRE family transcriptional regulator